MRFFIVLFSLLFSRFLLTALAQIYCGPKADYALCREGECCNKWGWCGTKEVFCGPEYCGSQCPGDPPPLPPPPPPPPPTPTGDVSDTISESMFDELLPHRDDCPSKGFYNYSSFVTAARSFPGFGTTGDTDARKREISAFLAQTSHQTNDIDDPDESHLWGYCIVEEPGNPSDDYCEWDGEWPCAPDKRYFGRGPMQLKYNANYGQCGNDIGEDLLKNPDLAATDPVISFKTAIWFWMHTSTGQVPKPSCHDAILELWQPSNADMRANRLPGFGLTTNIINGTFECGRNSTVDATRDRIEFYIMYCAALEVSPNPFLDCAYQKPFGYGVSHNTM